MCERCPRPYTLNGFFCARERVCIKRKKQLSTQYRLLIAAPVDREFLIDNLLVRIRYIFEMIWWTGLAL